MQSGRFLKLHNSVDKIFESSIRLSNLCTWIGLFSLKIFCRIRKSSAESGRVGSQGGGHSLKICDGYVRPHWPPFSNLLSLNDPLFILHILLSPNDPHFQNALSLNDPFLEIYPWKWGSCSHWVTPIFTDKWRPRDTNVCTEYCLEGLCSC